MKLQYCVLSDRVHPEDETTASIKPMEMYIHSVFDIVHSARYQAGVLVDRYVRPISRKSISVNLLSTGGMETVRIVMEITTTSKKQRRVLKRKRSIFSLIQFIIFCYKDVNSNLMRKWFILLNCF